MEFDLTPSYVEYSGMIQAGSLTPQRVCIISVVFKSFCHSHVSGNCFASNVIMRSDLLAVQGSGSRLRGESYIILSPQRGREPE
jgi:hypothetical protein